MSRIEHRLLVVSSTGIIRAVLVSLLAIGIASAAGCTPDVATPAKPTATVDAVALSEPAILQVNVNPAGSTILIDGQPQGNTPLTISLAAGQYNIRVEKSGYRSLEQALVLPPAGQKIVSGDLVDVMSPALTVRMLPRQPRAGQNLIIYLSAHDNVAVVRIELWIDEQRVLEEIGATAIYHWNLGPNRVGQHLVLVRAYDVTGNVAVVERDLVVAAPILTPTFTPSPTITPPPLPTATPAPTATHTPQPTATSIPRPTLNPPVSVYYETTLSIPTYPYADYLWQETDVRYGMFLWRLNREAYEAAQPEPAPQNYRALVIENEYLRLTFLPELGGRLYSCIYKPTGQEIFYHNPVIKPSLWGALVPAEHNWWLAVGGMEWALPVHEHGYEFGNAWDYSVETTSQGTAVTLWDSRDDNRLQFEVRVTLPLHQAVFTVQPRLSNPLSGDVNVQLWINAMLTLGSQTISPDTEFILPAGPVIVHSTGDLFLAAEGQSISWPMHSGRDLARYTNWRQWLGIFVQQPDQNFAGAYNHATGLGVARIFPAQTVPGLKLFAFGSDFGERDHYTDDGSQYFELWGGLNNTFWPADDLLVPAGGDIIWQETWYPFANIGGLVYATEKAALYLERQEEQIDFGLSVSMPVQGQVRLVTGEGEGEQIVWAQAVELSPDNPLRLQVVLAESLSIEAIKDSLTFKLIDLDGVELLNYNIEN